MEPEYYCKLNKALTIPEYVKLEKDIKFINGIYYTVYRYKIKSYLYIIHFFQPALLINNRTGRKTVLNNYEVYVKKYGDFIKVESDPNF